MTKQEWIPLPWAVISSSWSPSLIAKTDPTHRLGEHICHLGTSLWCSRERSRFSVSHEVRLKGINWKERHRKRGECQSRREAAGGVRGSGDKRGKEQSLAEEGTATQTLPGRHCPARTAAAFQSIPSSLQHGLNRALIFSPCLYPTDTEQWQTGPPPVSSFAPVQRSGLKDSAESCTGNSLHVVMPPSLQNLHTWDSHRLGWEFCA